MFVSLLGTDELSLFVDQQNKTDEIRSTGEFMEDCLNIEYFKANGTKVLIPAPWSSTKLDVIPAHIILVSLET